jgi:Fungal fucose-specific lectin
VNELGWDNGWYYSDLTGGLGVIPVSMRSGLTCFGWGPTQATRLYYIDQNNHVNEIGWDNGWYNFDITGDLLNKPKPPQPASGLSGLTGFGWGPTQATRLYYIDANYHVNEIGWGSNGWYNSDITGQTKGPPAQSWSGLTCFGWGPTQATRLYYIDAYNRVNEISWGNGWYNFDITNQINGPYANPWTGLTCFGWGPTQATRLYYIDQNNHVNEIGWDNGWYNSDTTTVAKEV